MALETVSMEHVPNTHQIHIALFNDVQNASFLHQQLLARNVDFEYAFIDASIVLSRVQLLSAVFKAVSAQVTDTLKTPNAHSEIVISLNPSSNISDAYRRFGISPSTKDLLVVKVTFPTPDQPEPRSDSDIWKHLTENVQGTPQSITDENIAKTTDLPKVRKYYKLNGINWLDAIEDLPTKHKEMEVMVIGAMALRGV